MALYLVVIDDDILMVTTQNLFTCIEKSMQSIIHGSVNIESIEAIPDMITHYDEVLDAYRQKNIFQQLSMDESFAIVSVSIALKKSLDLMQELILMN